MTKIIFCCAKCSSEEVSRDAYADWDPETQQWVLGAVYDNGFCHSCESDRQLEEKPYIEREE